ncbi:hypothetical protein HNQ80_000595 [Anaerosolibacter carboniphilus]|uniref:Exo-alpha-sialidase n=1 Tax=Anaerosolibacter carboniphilus TaxID=1417629 RepID=A0A841KWF9_9FIRM|nr:sialidase family protein [Anaerosolibacter carboniphilus]MBB6214515.1 hypothetical protein [Anaerosolibacter carboniphilus]
MIVNVRQLLTKKFFGGIMNMKNKTLSMLDTAKKKVGAIALCGALVAAIGAGTAFAANSITSLQVKMENGVRSYSMDDGKTWSQNAPDGIMVNDKDGKLTISSGTPPKDSEGKGLLSKVENGVRSYSTDGGETWSEKAPDGAKDGVTIGEDGKITHMNGIPSGDANGTGLQIKMENGVRFYSTDGGKTWSKNAPNGVTIGDDGKIIMMNGTLPKDGEGEGLLSKVENGVRTYSTDGGKTWSEKAPDGAEDSVTIGN